jgi:hypothetical protein
VVGRTFGALDRENVNIVAIAQGSTECTISFVVAKRDMKAALASIHQEFELGSRPESTMAEPGTQYPCYGRLPAGHSHSPAQEE